MSIDHVEIAMHEMIAGRDVEITRLKTENAALREALGGVLEALRRWNEAKAAVVERQKAVA